MANVRHTSPSEPSDHHGALRSRPRRQRLEAPDAALAALVIGIVGLMIVPLPTWLLDLLLSANLALAVTVLLVTLYVTDALKIATFPSLLLITTLVRLALNVSSTRLILLQADAGQIIHAFGSFVVRGNYVVGAVIFLILSIIQFVVIAKGSERVAEVGARFTLDAMPGKQMAIDAELRSGGIDGNEARRQRRQLARESQFYGAMDGAMKFVKGDVIASFLITLINIVGGLCIGVLQRDMDAAGALKRYGLLTIGDGLVTQIPSLVLSTAAGILVTRVASEEQQRALGQELTEQLLATPRALGVAALFVVALGLIPGLPAPPLLAIGAGLLLASRLKRSGHAPESGELGTQPVERSPSVDGGPRFVPVVVPWSLELSTDLSEFLEDESRGDQLLRPGLRSVGNAVREVVFRELGVPIPACIVRVSEALPARSCVLSIHEVPTRMVQLEPELSVDELAPALMDRIQPLIAARAADFLGISETQMLLDRLEHIAPATVRQVTPKPVSLGLLTDILKRLVEERVSIRDLKGILEGLAQVATADRDPLNLTEFVRTQLRRPLTHQATRGAAELSVLMLSPDIEDTIRGAISRTASGSFLTLAPALGRDIITAVKRALQHAIDQAPDRFRQDPVLLTQPDIRRFVRKLLETELGQVRVMAYSELLPEIAVHNAATANIKNL